jgi:hypothetical protein
MVKANRVRSTPRRTASHAKPARMRRKPRERAVATFPAIDVDFDWGNDKWALTFLPSVRAAALTVAKDEKALEQICRTAIDAGNIGDIDLLLDAWLDTTKHLESLVKLLDCALARSSIVLERLDYENS